MKSVTVNEESGGNVPDAATELKSINTTAKTYPNPLIHDPNLLIALTSSLGNG